MNMVIRAESFVPLRSHFAKKGALRISSNSMRDPRLSNDAAYTRHVFHPHPRMFNLSIKFSTRKHRRR